MLFFELFPAFVMLVSLLVGVGLFIANRRASNDASAREEPGRSTSESNDRESAGSA